MSSRAEQSSEIDSKSDYCLCNQIKSDLPSNQQVPHLPRDASALWPVRLPVLAGLMRGSADKAEAAVQEKEVERHKTTWISTGRGRS